MIQIFREAESYNRVSPYSGIVQNPLASNGEASTNLGTDGEWLEFDIQQNTAGNSNVVAWVQRAQVSDTNVVARLVVNGVNYDVQVPQTSGVFSILFANVAFPAGVSSLRISGISGEAFVLDRFGYEPILNTTVINAYGNYFNTNYPTSGGNVLGFVAGTDSLEFVSGNNVTLQGAIGSFIQFAPASYGSCHVIYLHKRSGEPQKYVRVNDFGFYFDTEGNNVFGDLSNWYGVNQTENLESRLDLMPAMPAGVSVASLEAWSDNGEILDLVYDFASKNLSYKVMTDGQSNEIIGLFFKDVNGKKLIEGKRYFEDGIFLPPPPQPQIVTQVGVPFNIYIPQSTITDSAILRVQSASTPLTNLANGLQGTTQTYTATLNEEYFFTLEYPDGIVTEANSTTPSVVGSQPPSYSTTSPQENNLQIVGTGITGSTIKVYRFNQLIGTTTVVNGAWSYTPTIDGLYSFTQVETNKAESAKTSDFVVETFVTSPSVPNAPVVTSSGTTQVGGTITGTIAEAGNIIVFLQGVEVEMLQNQIAGSFSYIPQNVGNYTFALSNVNGTSNVSTAVLVENVSPPPPPQNVPDAPTATAQVGKISVASGTGTVKIFKDGVEIATQASTGAFNYVPTAAGTYTFKLVTAAGTSAASNAVVVTTETDFVTITKMCPSTATSLQLGTGATAAEVTNWQTAAIYENTVAGVTTKRADVTFLLVGGLYPKYWGRNPDKPTESLSNGVDFTNAV